VVRRRLLLLFLTAAAASPGCRSAEVAEVPDSFTPCDRAACRVSLTAFSMICPPIRPDLAQFCRAGTDAGRGAGYRACEGVSAIGIAAEPDSYECLYDRTLHLAGARATLRHGATTYLAGALGGSPCAADESACHPDGGAALVTTPR
jgi:hypothetical protein